MPKFVFEDCKFTHALQYVNGKSVINLALGDPKKEDGYALPENLNQAVIDVIQSGKYNGYTFHKGSIDARQAVVDK